jgi:hypothetical protein
MSTFFDEFIRSQGKPIEHKGQTVHIAHKVSVAPGTVLRFNRLRAARSPVQGMRITAKGCELEVAGTKGKQFVLWADTAPVEVDVNIKSAKSGKSEVSCVNVWRDAKHGSTFQGMNYSGIMVEPQGNSYTLRCSDGVGPADFSDLVVRITVEGL